MDKSFAGRHILVVEDEMMLFMMIEEILTDLGACVTAAATVGQALAKIDAQEFDVATLDLNLGGNESYPVADILAHSIRDGETGGRWRDPAAGLTATGPGTF